MGNKKVFAFSALALISVSLFQNCGDVKIQRNNLVSTQGDSGPQVCSPNSEASCEIISNGTSIKTCNSQGSAFANCIVSCNTGFKLVGSVCEADPLATQYDILMSLYNLTNGANWTNRAGWGGVRGTECAWYGITCVSRFVTEIKLDSNNLVGPLPSNLNQLRALKLFRINQNKLSGSIPSLAGLTNLHSFYVHTNQLTGSIPSLEGLANLYYFYALDNKLSGSIPPLAGLVNLQHFYVAINQLTGSIPPLVGLANLNGFYVHSNQLAGSIPPLAGLANLNQFMVHSNQLTGSIPPLAGLANLQIFYAQTNQLSGSIPSLAGLTNLIFFNVCSNAGIVGPKPDITGTKLTQAGSSYCGP